MAQKKGETVMFATLHQGSIKDSKCSQRTGKGGKPAGIHVHLYGISLFFFFSIVGFQLWYLLKRESFFPPGCLINMAQLAL